MKENLFKVLEQIEANPELKEKFDSYIDNSDGDSSAEVLFDELLGPIAQEAGIALTVDDITDFCKEAEGIELTDEALERIAGGSAQTLVINVAGTIVRKIVQWISK